MNDIFRELLEPHIKLNYTKTVVEKNKKIISTCIFLPENPSISIKTPVYILGMIKLVETFNEYMSDGGWILRIYYDSMFDIGVKLKQLEKVVKEEEKEARNESPNNNTTSLYEYEYNTMIPTPQNNPTARTIKENINANKIYLKKIIKLAHLYFEHIRTSKDKRYERIELISYDCQSASNYPDIIGHPATFGSIMRFMALYDEEVERVFCINSRYAFTPLQKMLIDSWDTNEEEKMFSIEYDANQFIPRIINLNLYDNAFEIIEKQAFKKELTSQDKLFINVINNIYELKESIFKTGSIIKFEEQERVKERKAYKLLLGITTSSDDFNARWSLNNSIGAGFFGIKKDCPHYNERINIFAQLLKYYIVTKNKFRFGIDELLLKVVLAFEVGTCNYNYKNKIHYLEKKIKLPSKYIHNIYGSRKTCYDLNYLKNDKTFLETTDGKKIIIKKKITNGFSFNSYIMKDDTIDIGVINTRSLYEILGGGELKPSDKIVKKICKNKDFLYLDFFVLFTSFDEEKKLFLIDSSRSDFLKYLFNAEISVFIGPEKYGSLYTSIDLNAYKNRDINKLLDTIISYYRQKFNPNIIKFVDGDPYENDYNNSNNNSNNTSNEANTKLNKTKKATIKITTKVSGKKRISRKKGTKRK